VVDQGRFWRAGHVTDEPSTAGSTGSAPTHR
jgi:hypothetical protein